MPEHVFISYSSVDGQTLAWRLADELQAGPPAVPVWLDKREIDPGSAWAQRLADAIGSCRALLLLLTPDSIGPQSVCQQELDYALSCKRPVVPLLAHPDAHLPFRLQGRDYIDFTGAFGPSLARLRRHLVRMDTPEGRLQALRDRLADAEHDLARARPERQARIAREMADLQQQISQLQAVIDDPQGAADRVARSIANGLERARQPEPAPAARGGRSVNPPPLVAPSWFQNRQSETAQLGRFLADPALRMLTVVGRGGVGKSAMVCRLLRALEAGQLPDDGGPLPVDGIVYLSNARAFHRISLPDLLTGLGRLLPEATRQFLESVYRQPQIPPRETMRQLLEAFPGGRTVVLLDNFEDLVDIETGRLCNPELDEALRAVLELPPHGLKLLVTTRVAPRELAMVEPGRQRRLDLNNGLESPYAENLLRAMDADGQLGLRDAPAALLDDARLRTRGFPRALEHLFGILSADRSVDLHELLDNTRALLPEQVTQVLVGEAYSRLDPTAQQVMQGLAVYRYPVPAAALDHLLLPHVAGIDSALVLSRLVNMQFAHRDAGRFHLHQTDLDHALTRLPEGQPADREADPPPFTRYALQHRAADWFSQTRKPRATWQSLDDLSAQLWEFELRMAGGECDTAADLLSEIDADYLLRWGHYRLVADLRQRLQPQLKDSYQREVNQGRLGMAHDALGHFDAARDAYQQALDQAQARGDAHGIATWTGNLAGVQASLGEIDQATLLLERVLADFRRLGDESAQATALSNLANLRSEVGEIQAALQLSQQALALRRTQQDPDEQATVLVNLAGLQLDLDDTAAAELGVQQALALARERRNLMIEAGSLCRLGSLRQRQERSDEALQAYRQAVAIADDIGHMQFQVGARLGLADAQLSLGDAASALATVDGASALPYPGISGPLKVTRGTACARLGRWSEARQAFTEASQAVGTELQGCALRHQWHDLLALALCGRRLCGEAVDADQPAASWRQAQAINGHAGRVKDQLRAFDQLAAADAQHRLAGLRKLIASPSPAAAAANAAPGT